MRVDGKQGAGIPQDIPAAKPAATAAKKTGAGRPPKPGKPSAYMLKKYGSAGTPKASTKQAPKTIHNVIILDKSSSMAGSKYKNAMQGISLNHRALGFETAEHSNLSYVLTYMLFGTHGDEDWMYKGVKYEGKVTKDLDWSNRQYPSGSTALYDAIYNVGEYLKGKTAPESDQVLINIFTDGGENDSIGPLSGGNRFSSESKVRVEAYIKELQEKYGYTVTFVGTKGDVQNAIRDLGFDASNTLAYDGTGEGLAATMSSNIQSRAIYSKSVLEDKDVSKGFYSKSLTNE